MARRWVAALMLAPVEEREAIVASVEQRMTALYGTPTPHQPEEPRLIHAVSPAAQRDGYVEQIVRTYEAPAVASSARTGSGTRASVGKSGGSKRRSAG